MKLHILKLSLVLMALAQSGCWLNSPLAPPLGGAPPSPVCGFTDSGGTLCIAQSPGLTIIRSQAEWNTLAGNPAMFTITVPPTACIGAGPIPVVDFNSQMILVYTISECSLWLGTGAAFDSVCLYSDRMEVDLTMSSNSAIMAPLLLGYCQNTAVVVSKTSLPVNFNECQELWGMNGFISSTCVTIVY